MDLKNSIQLQEIWKKKQFKTKWAVEKNPSGELVEPDPFLDKVEDFFSDFQRDPDSSVFRFAFLLLIGLGGI